MDSISKTEAPVYFEQVGILLCFEYTDKLKTSLFTNVNSRDIRENDDMFSIKLCRE